MNRKKTGQLLKLEKQKTNKASEMVSLGSSDQETFDLDSLGNNEEFKQIQEIAKECGFQNVQLIRTKDIVVAHWVGLKCRYGCANYNKSWCCPPVAPDIRMTKELLGEYQLALLLIKDTQDEDSCRNSTAKRRLQAKRWKGTLALERKLLLRGYHKAFGLPAETCALCKTCSYPEPCKFPSEKRPSVEACSIDIMATVRQVSLGKRLELDGQDRCDSYSLILLM